MEILLDEAWRVFSNREEAYRRGQRKLIAAIQEKGEREVVGEIRLYWKGISALYAGALVIGKGNVLETGKGVGKPRRM